MIPPLRYGLQKPLVLLLGDQTPGGLPASLSKREEPPRLGVQVNQEPSNLRSR